MIQDVLCLDTAITFGADPPIIRVGRSLRKTKIDELAELIKQKSLINDICIAIVMHVIPLDNSIQVARKDGTIVQNIIMDNIIFNAFINWPP